MLRVSYCFKYFDKLVFAARPDWRAVFPDEA
jgi:hypothetical protein